MNIVLNIDSSKRDLETYMIIDYLSTKACVNAKILTKDILSLFGFYLD